MLFVFSLSNCNVHYSALNLKKDAVQRQLLKDYFLCVCITEGFKDKQIAENDIYCVFRYSPI